MGRIRDWLTGRKEPQTPEAKSYSVQLLVGDDGFMAAQQFTGGSLYTVLTQAIWTYICASRISKDISTFPAVVQTRKPGTARWVTDLDHDLNELLYRPYGMAPFAPRLDWQQSLAAGVLRQELAGNQFYLTSRAGNRLLMLALSMLDLRANVTDSSTGLFDSYTVTNSGARIPVDNVVNIFHANPESTWEGVSPTVANEQATRVNYSADRRNRYDLETRVQPGVVFKVESLFAMSEEQRTSVETMLATTFEGASKQGKSLVIGDNVTIEGAPLHPVDDIPGKDEAARDKVISSFDISPPMVGVLGDVKYSNLEKAMQLQYANCIGPRLLNIYNTINNQAVRPVYGPTVRLWFDLVQSPLGLAHLSARADTAKKYQDLGWPAKHLNDRFALEMDEFEGWDKANMSAVVAGRVPGEGSGDPAPEDEPEPPEPDEDEEETDEEDDA